MCLHRYLSFILLCCLSFLFGCCGYQWGTGSIFEDCPTLSLDCISGDKNGILTNELLIQLAESGNIRYRKTQAPLRLQVILLDYSEENIGFRYDREQNAELKRNVVPIETRFKVIAEITLVDNHTGKIIRGPDSVSASIDYDHDYYSDLGGVNVFSLGQLNDLDLAQQEAYRPLYKKMAKQIVNHVTHGW